MTTPGTSDPNLVDRFVEWLHSLQSDSALAKKVYENPEEELAKQGFDEKSLLDLDYQSLNQGLNLYPPGYTPPAPPYNFPPPPPGTPPADHVQHEVKNYVTHVYEGDEYVIDDRDTALQFQGDPTFHGDFEFDVDNITATEGAQVVNDSPGAQTLQDSEVTNSQLNTGDNVAQAGGNQEKVVAGEENRVAQFDIEQNTTGGTAGAGGAGGTATGGDASGGAGGYGTGGAGGAGGDGGTNGHEGHDQGARKLLGQEQDPDGRDPGSDGGDGGYGGAGTGGAGGDGGYGGDASADGGYGGSADTTGGQIDIDIDFGDDVEEPVPGI